MTLPDNRPDVDVDRALAAEANFIALMDAAVDAIIVITRDGTIETFNAAAEKLFGFRAAEIVGRNVRDLMPEPDRSAHDGYLRRYLKTGEARIIGIGRVTTAQRRDGSTFPIELSVGAAQVSGDRRFVGIVRDITEMRSTAEQLRRSEEQLRRTLDFAPMGIATVALDGRFLSVNPACCRMLGCQPADLLALGIDELTDPDQREEVRAALASVAGGASDNAVVDKRCRRPDGQWIDARLHIAAVHEADGAPSMFVVQVEDRTEMLAARRDARHRRNQLAHVTRLSTLGEMAAGIAHEINQPLTAIATYSEACKRLVERGKAQSGDVLETLTRTGAQAQRAGEVIRRVRALARQRAGEHAPARLNDVVRDVIALADVDARLADIDLRLSLADGLPDVEIDAIQIQQVLLNLVRNGIEAMEACQHAVLDVSTQSVDGDMVSIEVRDRGPGIPDSVASRIFDPFFTTKEAGTGLGLSISRTIVEAHGGTLTLETDRDGPGVTFRVTLPTAAGETR